MPNEFSGADTPPADETIDFHSLEGGVALVLEAEDGGDWRPLVRWLAGNPELAGEVAQFVIDQDRMRGAVPARAVAPDLTGSALGDYELGERLGGGTFGDVYRARHRRIAHEVAIKLVRAAGMSAVGRARARFEAEAMAGLDHPNVVPLLHHGETESVLYFVMPLMSGTLADRLRERGPNGLSPDEAARVVRDIARGVHHAHQRELIHRDLKPANVLLDREGHPRGAACGRARRADATASTVAGAPAYMAPEQARGEIHLTPAADVHALGVILFELLTGRVPFTGKDVMSVIRKVIEEPPPSPRSLRPDVPRDLEAICMKCLEKRPEDRYPSAEALAEDLDRFLNGQPPCGPGRGWVWDSVGRALFGSRRETLAMASWRIMFYGAASTALAMGAMQAATLLNAPLWVSQAAVGYYLFGWLAIMWAFLVARRHLLNPVERASTALHFGAKFACLAVLPAALSLHGGDPVYALPSFLALVGLSVFAHGVTYWGRLYLHGLAILAVAAAMPLVPVRYWPTVYGAVLVAQQLWGGFHLRRVHRDAEAARRTDTHADLK